MSNAADELGVATAFRRAVSEAADEAAAADLDMAALTLRDLAEDVKDHEDLLYAVEAHADGKLSAGAVQDAVPEKYGPTEVPDSEALAYIASSSYRTLVLRHIRESPRTPSKIAQKSGINIAHVSRALGELQDRGFAELLVPEDTHKGRVYGATEQGRELAEVAEEAGIIE